MMYRCGDESEQGVGEGGWEGGGQEKKALNRGREMTNRPRNSRQPNHVLIQLFYLHVTVE